MSFPRAAGILLHPTSLPSRFGIGDLGPEAYEFVDRLAAASQTYWQILPLNLTGWGGSPYAAVSAFAGNTLLVSPEKLVEDGLIDEADGDQAPQHNGTNVDLAAVNEQKRNLLKSAFEHFRAGGNTTLKPALEAFDRENSWWLDDAMLFMALKDANEGRPWADWSEPLRMRDRDAIERASVQFAREIDALKYAQFLFFRQWMALRKYANEKGIRIIGDIPIFVAYDSADVWCNQKFFKLDEAGRPLVVAGVPPDFFSSTGQLWGNPIFAWDAMSADHFGWWTARMAFTLRSVDVVRLDHFIGFVRNWEVPAGDKTAENGAWVDVPGDELFAAVKAKLGELPIIVEDLGAVTPEVELLRDTNGFPGMRILQNAFGGDARNQDLPHNYVRNCVAYTGTHDNDTTPGWFGRIPKNVKRHCRKYLHSSGRDIAWDMMRSVWSSVAHTAIAPMQDVLSLGSEARMNTPATSEGNWRWRLGEGEFTDDHVQRLREMTELFGRAQNGR
jgi:4-alpha-glucanotransferase